MKTESTTLSITNTTKGKLPRLPFATIHEMKDKILGKNYELSIACVGDATSKRLNMKLRGKNYPTNILSFELSKTSGELVFNLKKVAQDAPLFEKNFAHFFGFLLIHGMLHLKGMQHGSTMESMETKWSKYFGF